jgi:hypothetical protein
MFEHLFSPARPFEDMDLHEKRDYLNVLSDVVRDMEAELAQAKADRAALMNSLQLDAHGQPPGIQWPALRF